MAKPTGNRGPIRIHGTFPDIKVDYQKVAFPKEKADIEALIVGAFLQSVEGTDILRRPFLDLKQNPIDDFDFIDAAAAAAEPTYLELMEIAPLEDVSGGYSGARSSYRSYDFSEQALAKLMSKSERYSVSEQTRLCLLMYTTDWRFNLSETVVKLLQYWCASRPHAFSEIYAFEPSSSSDGHPHLIYPVSAASLEGFDPERHRNDETYNMNPGQGVLRVDADRGELSFGWEVPVNQGTVRVGRNDPCPCGSGRKYKRCHGR